MVSEREVGDRGVGYAERQNRSWIEEKVSYGMGGKAQASDGGGHLLKKTLLL